MTSVAEIEALFGRCSAMMVAVGRLPQAVIAKVHGLATAAGRQLVAACDLAVASSSATFATPGVNIGAFCSTPGVSLGRAVGRKHAMEMLLTGEAVGAERAREMGLINRVVAPEALDGEVHALARLIASKSPAAIATGKRVFSRQLEMPLEEAYAFAGHAIAADFFGDDGKEGVDAFLGKRAAVESSLARGRHLHHRVDEVPSGRHLELMRHRLRHVEGVARLDLIGAAALDRLTADLARPIELAVHNRPAHHDRAGTAVDDDVVGVPHVRFGARGLLAVHQEHRVAEPLRRHAGVLVHLRGGLAHDPGRRFGAPEDRVSGIGRARRAGDQEKGGERDRGDAANRVWHGVVVSQRLRGRDTSQSARSATTGLVSDARRAGT